MRSEDITVTIDLDRIRANAEAIRARTNVDLIAVIKADAYGLGAPPVADALAPVVDDFAYFDLEEAREVGRPGLVLGPPVGNPQHYRQLGVRPTITTLEDAERFKGVRAAINVDTGMQRFGCDPDVFDQLVKTCRTDEAFSHGIDPAMAERLRDLAAGKVSYIHVACSGMLDQPMTFLDAVRPGIALYHNAVRVTTRLAKVRSGYGPAGYTSFAAEHFGLFGAGYAEGVLAGPVVINGRRQRIIEVNMNASFVSTDPGDRAGDEVVLLGDELPAAELAEHFGVRVHEIICRFAGLGIRHYAGRQAERLTRAPGDSGQAPRAR